MDKFSLAFARNLFGDRIINPFYDTFYQVAICRKGYHLSAFTPGLKL